jgi:hypothetical protein
MNRKGSAPLLAHILLPALVTLLAVLLLILLQTKPASTATLPPSFEDHLLTSIDKPIALAFTPDGRIIIATQPGQLRVYKNGQLLQTPALDISSKLCTN